MRSSLLQQWVFHPTCQKNVIAIGDLVSRIHQEVGVPQIAHLLLCLFNV
jgi:hypothetical protein